jgi:hypothetical protein
MVDRTTAGVVAAFRAAGIRALVLKGPAFARWLYDDAIRSYGDTDLLIAERDTARAERVLESQGYKRALGDTDVPPYNRRLHAHSWCRADGPAVDLHRSLAGATVPAAEVWSALTDETETIEVEGITVEILGATAQAVHAALHAAAHGAGATGPLDDLARALQRADLQRWRSAAELASQLGALASFSAGLSLLPSGRRLISELELRPSIPTEIELRASSSPRLALHLEWLNQTAGWRPKLRLAWQLLVPPRAFIEAEVAPGRWHRARLIGAYLARMARLPRHAPAGLSAWWRTRKPRRS